MDKRFWRKACFFLIVSTAILFLGATVKAEEALVINSAAQPPMVNEEHTGFLDELTKEIFRRLGRGVEVVVMNANARTLINVNKGIDDGNLVRIKGIDKIFKNLRRVPEHMTIFEFVCFAKDPAIRVDKWEDLEPYNVAFIRGWKILEQNVKKAKSINQVKDSGQLFELLQSDRADIVIFGPLRGKYILEKKGIKGVSVLSPPLASKKVYLYLNKRHEAIIPAITKALVEIKSDGTYARIFERTVGHYVSNEERQRLLQE